MHKRWWVIAVIAMLICLLCGGILFARALSPVKQTKQNVYFRIYSNERFSDVLSRLEKDGLIRSAAAVRLYFFFSGDPGMLKYGTYEIDPSRSAVEIIRSITRSDPIRQMVLIREGLWTEEVCELLSEKSVATKEELQSCLSTPEAFQESYGFVPATDSLEGYLFPDTYDFPPLLGADKTIRKFAETFREKIYVPLAKPDPAKLHKWVIMASMIELEAKHDADRARIAGVIENRLQKGMPLQIDATIIYARKKRGPVLRSEYKWEHPYSTYTNKGLPPGPICNPGRPSLFAAANPEKHDYLYYVAMPDGTHLFATTYEQHLKNIEKSKIARKGALSNVEKK